MAEGGGTGITTMPVLQSMAQARDKWGEHAASAIWDASIVKVILGAPQPPKTSKSSQLSSAKGTNSPTPPPSETTAPAPCSARRGEYRSSRPNAYAPCPSEPASFFCARRPRSLRASTAGPTVYELRLPATDLRAAGDPGGYRPGLGRPVRPDRRPSMRRRPAHPSPMNPSRKDLSLEPMAWARPRPVRLEHGDRPRELLSR